MDQNSNSLPNIEQAILQVAAAVLAQNDRLTYVGSIAPGSTGDKVITGVGFTPRSIIFFGALTAAVSSTANAGGSVGFVDYQKNQFCGYFTTRSGNGGISGTATDRIIDLYTIAAGGGSSSNNIRASLVSFDSDGFTINVSVWANTHTVGFICFS